MNWDKKRQLTQLLRFLLCLLWFNDPSIRFFQRGSPNPNPLVLVGTCELDLIMVNCLQVWFHHSGPSTVSTNNKEELIIPYARLERCIVSLPWSENPVMYHQTVQTKNTCKKLSIRLRLTCQLVVVKSDFVSDLNALFWIVDVFYCS